MGPTLYIDPAGGVAGDMLLGALVDLGVHPSYLREVLGGLRLEGWTLLGASQRHQGVVGTSVRVVVESERHPARRLAGVEALLGGAELPERVRARALAAFRRLFAAEAEVHGVAAAEVHLHELAGADTVVEIAGVCAAVEALAVDRIVCGPVPTGRGTVRTEHGVLALPAPAVAHLLRGVPLAAPGADGEITTPTGAVLVVTLADEFGRCPSRRIVREGVGLGTRTFAGVPGSLRALLLE